MENKENLESEIEKSEGELKADTEDTCGYCGEIISKSKLHKGIIYYGGETGKIKYCSETCGYAHMYYR
jgi:hypothetical protein